MFPALFRGELVRQFARFGGQTAAGRFLRAAEFLWRDVFWLFHNGFNLPFPTGECKRYIAFAAIGTPAGNRTQIRGLEIRCSVHLSYGSRTRSKITPVARGYKLIGGQRWPKRPRPSVVVRVFIRS